MCLERLWVMEPTQRNCRRVIPERLVLVVDGVVLGACRLKQYTRVVSGLKDCIVWGLTAATL